MEHSQHQPEENTNVEVNVNGKDGPSVKFRIGIIALVQIAATMLAFGGASAIMRADVDHLKIEVGHNKTVVDQILQQVIELKSTTQYLRDDVRYYREQIDKLQQERRSQ